MIQIITDKNGSSLSFTEYGGPAGFPILAQHGLIASIKDGWYFNKLIEGGVRVICVARPGYGESSPVELENIGAWGGLTGRIIAHLGLERFDVLGMSSGAPYAYAVANQNPETVRNVYIFSGTPALYDQDVLALWPFGSNLEATIPELQKLAYDLFFAPMPAEVLAWDDFQDSRKNDCFGLAQDFKLRVRDWGFSLRDLRAPVYMRHSRADESVPFAAAELTARMLPNCHFEPRENEPHFSQALLDNFIETVILPRL